MDKIFGYHRPEIILLYKNAACVSWKIGQKGNILKDKPQGKVDLGVKVGRIQNFIHTCVSSIRHSVPSLNVATTHTTSSFGAGLRSLQKFFLNVAVAPTSPLFHAGAGATESIASDSQYIIEFGLITVTSKAVT